MMHTILFFLFLSFFAVAARQVDTVIIADGSPGPYTIGRKFIDTATIDVSFPDTPEKRVPPFTYINKVNGILFSESIDSATVLRIRYETDYYGIDKMYLLYPKRTAQKDRSDSTYQDLNTPGSSAPGYRRSESLNVSGYKSIGISVGNLGQFNLEQALDIAMSGEIGPETSLEAHLSDQGTSLEGATREISEIDMIYVSLTHPRFGATVGDQYVGWIDNGLLSAQKKIKGISGRASARNGILDIGVFGALSGGKYALQTFRGENGLQGPYQLTGNGEAELITPVSGTVTVTVNGERVEEGERNDYTVDYDLGSITFTPSFLVHDEDIISVEYEYKTFNYQRTFAGANVSSKGADSIVAVDGVVWVETDNKNNAIELELDEADKRALSAAGDAAPVTVNAREVHPNDVAGYDALYALYRYRADSASGDSVFVYSPYDPDMPDSTSGYYLVWFRKARSGGAYIFDTLDCRNDNCRDIYRYVGEGLGTHTPLSPLPAPQRVVNGEIRTRISPRSWLQLDADVAGQHHDRNLFSERDDGDNIGAATATAVRLGSKGYELRSAWIEASHNLVSETFTRQVLHAAQRRERWDDENLDAREGAEQWWDAAGGVTLFPNISTEISYGQMWRRDSLATDRIFNTTRIGMGKHIMVSYNGKFFRHAAAGGDRRNRRDDATLAVSFTNSRWSAGVFDERIYRYTTP
jgi:hypothetical protein